MGPNCQPLETMEMVYDLMAIQENQHTFILILPAGIMGL
jgi:hypothetical protein